MKIVGVVCANPETARARLMRALEAAYPVQFEFRRDPDPERLDAMLYFGEHGADLAENARVPALVTGGEPPVALAMMPADVHLTTTIALDPLLRGRVIRDDSAGALAPIRVEPGDTVLALAEGRPVWIRRPARKGAGAVHVAVQAPEELGPAEPLRDRLREGSFLALLPLVHFLREITAPDCWVSPPLRAAFILDDPNLHLPSYGHVRYGALARHARTHGYHVAMATIPLDGWYVHDSAAAVFRENEDVLSLLVHGNDHVHMELARPRPEHDSIALLAQAMRRVNAVERRAKVRVSRVMAAPHERCSEVAMNAMLSVGFEGIAISRPYSWRTQPPPDRPLANWDIAELVGRGFAALPRYHLDHSRADLIFRAFLSQPLILFGHHEDAEDGFNKLAEAATDVNRLGDVRWTSLEEILRSNYTTRRDGITLGVRAFSRRIRVPVPEGVERVWVESPRPQGVPALKVAVCGDVRTNLTPSATGWRSDPFLARPGATLEISLPPPGLLDPWSVPSPAWRPWPLVRRVCTEGRDRIRPLVRRAALARVAR